MIRVRIMTSQDITAVCAIEAELFGVNGWDFNDIRHVICKLDVIPLIAEYGSAVVGYLFYSVGKRRLEIIHVALAESPWVDDAATQLMERVKEKLTTYGRRRIVVHVRERHLEAQLWFRDQGFVATGVERGYFEDTGEDAYRMVYTAICHEDLGVSG